MMRKFARICIIAIFALPSIGYCQFAIYSNEFLNIGAGARGLAMGSAQTASVNDGTAGYWNPAGLVGVKDHPELNLMHADYFSGIGKYDYGSLSIPIQDNKRTLGISVLRFAIDDIPNTLFLVGPDGSVNYNNISAFSSSDMAFLLSFAQNIKNTETKKISFGVNAKVIYRNIGSFATAWGFGIDAGLQIHTGRAHFGVVVKDLTTTFNAWAFHFTDLEKQVLYLTKNAIPVKSTELTAPHISVGGGYNFKISRSINLLGEASADITFDGKRNTVISSNPVSVDPHLGLEADIKGGFFIRAGITNFQQGVSDGDSLNQKRVWIYQPSIGAGFKMKNVIIDYAFTSLANQSSPLYSNIFSLKVNLIKKEKEKK